MTRAKKNSAECWSGIRPRRYQKPHECVCVRKVGKINEAFFVYGSAFCRGYNEFIDAPDNFIFKTLIDGTVSNL